MNDPALKIPRIAFLGFCEQAATVREGPLPAWKRNLLGLKQIVFSPVYPLPISGLCLALQVYDLPSLSAFRISIRAPSGTDLYTLDLRLESHDGREYADGSDPDAVDALGPRRTGHGAAATLELAVPVSHPVWATVVLTLPNDAGVVLEPGTYSIFATDPSGEHPVGSIAFAHFTPPPLTADVVAAIRSNPQAAAFMTFNFGCKKCGSAFKAYAGLERDPRREADGHIFQQDLPERYRCKCGNIDIPLGFMRAGAHFALGRPGFNGTSPTFQALYNRSSFDTTYLSLRELIIRDRPEEDLQRFLTQNPLALHRFLPQRLFAKAPILTRYRTDFAILDHTGCLTLLEIERPGLRLVKKDGGIHSDLQHAMDQVRDWLHVVTQHRSACLTEIGIDPATVNRVRGVVVAGRDSDASDLSHLAKLKWTNFGDVEFLTWDDLAGSLAVMIQQVAQL